MNRNLTVVLRILIILFGLSSCACTSTKIHFFTEGISVEEKSQIRKLLEDNGFSVIENTLPTPHTILGPTVVYSPWLSRGSDLNLLKALLAESGYNNISEQIEHSGNHSYTRNNIGVYLNTYNDTIITSASSFLTQHTFQTNCPRSDGELQFYQDGIFILDLITWNEQDDSEILDQFKGTWSKTEVNGDPAVLLFFDNYQVFLKIQPFVRTLNIGTLTGTDLLNIQNSEPFPDCDFYFQVWE